MIRLKRPEQAAVVSGQAAEMLRAVHRVRATIQCTYRPPCGASAGKRGSMSTYIKGSRYHRCLVAARKSQRTLPKLYQQTSLCMKHTPTHTLVSRSKKVDPRQNLVALLQLSSTLQKLGRFQDALPLLLEAEETARVIAGWYESNRYGNVRSPCVPFYKSAASSSLMRI